MLIDAIDLEVQNVVHIELNGRTQLVALHDQNVLLVEFHTARRNWISLSGKEFGTETGLHCLPESIIAVIDGPLVGLVSHIVWRLCLIEVNEDRLLIRLAAVARPRMEIEEVLANVHA